MINVLPPEVKSQLNYAKRNSRLLRYVSLTGLVLLALSALLGTGFWYADRQINSYQQSLAIKQTERQSHAETEAKIESLQANLNLIDKLLTEKTRYSILLNDLAAVLPDNSYITHLTLTGDDKEPLEISVATDSFNRAAEVRNGLISSKRIKSADIQNVSENEDGEGYNAVIIAAFEPGQAR